MVSENEKYHGVVFSRLLKTNKNLQISKFTDVSSSSYIVNNVGLYIKYSTKRMSPWNFTFLSAQQDEIEMIHKNFGRVFIALVCGSDGIVALSYDELKQVLDSNISDVERIGISRPPRGKYRVTGTDGKLKRAIGDNEFPGKIF